VKIVAVSDSHGNPGLLREAVEAAQLGAPIDVLVHCGDGVRDLAAAEAVVRAANPDARVYAVRGNCDIGAFSVPALELFEANGVRVMASHGHAYGVKTQYAALLAAARERGAKIVFFGHTHRPLLEAVGGIYLINPGAICNHLPGNTAYARVLVDSAGGVRADLMPWLA